MGNLTQNELKEFKIAVEAMGALMAELLAAINATIEAAQKLYELSWQAYHNAGMPYGNSHDGLMRWIEEINETGRLQRRAEGIREHHQLLAYFRRQIEAKQIEEKSQ